MRSQRPTAPSTGRPALAAAIGAMGIGISLAGSMLTLTSPAAAFRRVGTYVTPNDLNVAGTLLLQVGLTLTIVVGVTIAVRLPGHPVGWLVLLLGSLLAVQAAVQGYTLLSFAPGRPALPAGSLAAWVDNWVWGVILAVLGGAMFVFPTGRPLSPSWLRAFLVAIAVASLGSTLFSLSPSPMPQTLGIVNPVAIDALGNLPFAIAYVPNIALPVIGAASMIVRYRRASSIERLQLRWVASAAALAPIALLALAAARGGPWQAVTFLLFLAAFATIPVAIGIAVLRYRLYAIDVIIRKTLVYGVLTLSLGAGYVVGVVVLQALLSGVAGQDTLAIAGATLIVAAAFRPVQRRLQDLIDRRFYRRHYDAARTATDLAHRLRSEVDAEVIEADLLAAVAETVQPTHLGFWLRPTTPVHVADAAPGRQLAASPARLGRPPAASPRASSA